MKRAYGPFFAKSRNEPLNIFLCQCRRNLDDNHREMPVQEIISVCRESLSQSKRDSLDFQQQSKPSSSVVLAYSYYFIAINSNADDVPFFLYQIASDAMDFDGERNTLHLDAIDSSIHIRKEPSTKINSPPCPIENTIDSNITLIGTCASYPKGRICLSFESMFERDLLVRSIKACHNIESNSNIIKNEKDKNESGIIIRLKCVDAITQAYSIIDEDITDITNNANVGAGSSSSSVTQLVPPAPSAPLVPPASSAQMLHYTNKEVSHQFVMSNLRFTFLIPNERNVLSDYLYTVLSQFNRGSITQTDMENARRRTNGIFQIGYHGFRCIHCNGTKGGHYFPTSVKNLHGVPSMMATHLFKCESAPKVLKHLLRGSKMNHRSQMQARKSKQSQLQFFTLLWGRIRNGDFDGDCEEKLEYVRSSIKELLIKYATASYPKENLIPKPKVKKEEPLVKVAPGAFKVPIVVPNKSKVIIKQEDHPMRSVATTKTMHIAASTSTHVHVRTPLKIHSSPSIFKWTIDSFQPEDFDPLDEINQEQQITIVDSTIVQQRQHQLRGAYEPPLPRDAGNSCATNRVAGNNWMLQLQAFVSTNSVYEECIDLLLDF